MIKDKTIIQNRRINEIYVGLLDPTSGPLCKVHKVCSEHVIEGYVLCCKKQW
jgi:hypothetical protein